MKLEKRNSSSIQFDIGAYFLIDHLFDDLHLLAMRELFPSGNSARNFTKIVLNRSRIVGGCKRDIVALLDSPIARSKDVIEVGVALLGKSGILFPVAHMLIDEICCEAGDLVVIFS